MPISTLHIRKLYKELLKYGQTLELTNKNYYQKRIKQEFVKNKELADPEKIHFFYNKGLELLKKKSII
ncbi:electron transfer flavoprotein regulatory factor 1 isoform X2 [Daktulosphaira vitifoliae]|uniref:electron transfer flavoprotein regulatory factor 1 isoform X2 n=1 Tax=Daktulosphaira vitifoliae TaxID=58002 RepID=UPI0021AA7279|nr:electron transfer flavoprotein regulatory factor 1 isoform X2 [Daktulosphaira vitifoliae]